MGVWMGARSEEGSGCPKKSPTRRSVEPASLLLSVVVLVFPLRDGKTQKRRSDRSVTRTQARHARPHEASLEKVTGRRLSVTGLDPLRSPPSGLQIVRYGVFEHMAAGGSVRVLMAAPRLHTSLTVMSVFYVPVCVCVREVNPVASAAAASEVGCLIRSAG